jgi:hypothetical protein
MLALLAVPEGAARGLLVVPLIAAVALRRARHLLSDTERSLWLWLSLLPPAFAVLFAPGRLVHLWIAWVGMAAGAAWLVAGVPRAAPAARRGAPGVLVVTTLGSAAFLVAMTHHSWPRYYLPLLPALMVVAGWGLEELRALAARVGPRVASGAILAATVAAVASIVPEYPEVHHAKAAAGSLAGPGPTLVLVSAVAFTLSAALAASRASAGVRGGSVPKIRCDAAADRPGERRSRQGSCGVVEGSPTFRTSLRRGAVHSVAWAVGGRVRSSSRIRSTTSVSTSSRPSPTS